MKKMKEIHNVQVQGQGSVLYVKGKLPLGCLGG